jgi:hypothetical protein
MRRERFTLRQSTSIWPFRSRLISRFASRTAKLNQTYSIFRAGNRVIDAAEGLDIIAITE